LLGGAECKSCVRGKKHKYREVFQAMRYLVKPVGVTLIILSLAGMLVWADGKPSVFGEEAGRFGGTLTIAISAEPVSLDVQKTPSNVTQSIGGHILEPLFAMDAAGTVSPVLAESCVWNEAKNAFALRIRQHVYFHNGQEMTSDDVFASLDRWRKFSATASTFNRFVPEGGITIVDTYTLEIAASSKFNIIGVFGYPTTNGVIYPAEIAAQVQIPNPIGTGPYMLDEWVPGDHITLIRYDGYQPVWGPSASGFAGTKIPYFDKIVFRFVPEDATRSELLRAGEVDFVDTILPIWFDELNETEGISPIVVKPIWTPVWRFNFKAWPAGMNAAQALKFRQACRAAVDMEELLQASASGSAEFYRLNPCLIAYPEQIWWNDVCDDTYNINDQDVAKQLLVESGYTNEPIRFMIANDIPWVYNPSLVLAEQLEEIGINIEIEVMTFGTILERRWEEDRWDIFSEGNSISYHPLFYSSYWGGQRPGWFTNDEAQNLLDVMVTSADFDEVYGASVRLTEILEENIPEIQSGDFFELRAASSDLQNLRGEYRSYFFWSTWRQE